MFRKCCTFAEKCDILKNKVCYKTEDSEGMLEEARKGNQVCLK